LRHYFGAIGFEPGTLSTM